MTNTTNTSSTGALAGDFKPAGKLNNTPFFDCDPDTFYKCVQGKKKNKHWKKFLGGEFGENIKNWASKNRNTNFMLRNTDTKGFIFAHKVI